MTSFAISLRALKPPLMLAGIGLLLINDHVLKASVPSARVAHDEELHGLDLQLSLFNPRLTHAFKKAMASRDHSDPKDQQIQVEPIGTGGHGLVAAE